MHKNIYTLIALCAALLLGGHDTQAAPDKNKATSHSQAGQYLAVEIKQKQKAAPSKTEPVANPLPLRSKFEDRSRQEYENHIHESRQKRRMWDTMMCPARVYERS